MDKDSVSPAAGDAREPAFYTMKVAREFGEELARQYKAASPIHLVSAFVEGLMNDGEVVSINQLLRNDKVTEWLGKIGASERQLRSAFNGIRKARRAAAAVETGVVVPPRRRKRGAEQVTDGA
ncbi:hypothetical protein [Sphingomonas sp. CCH5-D11]|uniref:hypothetical protein n=1 Tax=Sphingomonas sp. CCH5-D11 TaxID=1768786 RepID=UPI00082D6B52|nr:hypothetical protein [Sphingomonas sp. CCH5-D11]